MAIKKIAGDWRARIFLLFSVILIGTLFIQVAYIIPYIENQQLESAMRDHEYITISIAREADDEIQHIVDELTELANYTLFRNMVVENQSSFISQYTEAIHDIESLAVLNSTGWFVSGSTSLFEIYPPVICYDTMPFFYIPFEQGLINYGVPQWNDTTPNQVDIDISVPIRSDSRVIVGVLMGSLNLHDLITSISNYPLKEEVVAYLVDRRGIVVAHSEIDLFALEAGPLSLNYSTKELVQEAMLENQSVAHIHKHNTTDFFGMALFLNSTQWVLVVGAPLEAMMGEAELIATNLWIFNILLFGITMSIAMVFAQQIVKQQEQRTREIENMHEELSRQERLATLGKLSGSISHELRNPLAAIKNSIYLLRMVCDTSNSDIKETLDILDKEVKTSELIISSLLEYAHPKPPTRIRSELKNLVDSSLSRITIPKNVEVITNYDSDLPMILVDPSQMTRVIMNLGLNAIQAMRDGGTLKILGTISEPGWVSLSMSDTGVGMSEEIMDKLFDPLFTTKAKGIGLGLVICETIVKSHGGLIEVESEEGKGSTFTIRLPIKTEVEKQND